MFFCIFAFLRWGGIEQAKRNTTEQWKTERARISRSLCTSIAYRKNTKSLWPTVAVIIICSPLLVFCRLCPAEGAVGVSLGAAERAGRPGPAELADMGLLSHVRAWAVWHGAGSFLDPASGGSTGSLVWKMKTCPVFHRHINIGERAARAWAASLLVQPPPLVFLWWGNSIFHGRGESGSQIKATPTQICQQPS